MTKKSSFSFELSYDFIVEVHRGLHAFTLRKYAIANFAVEIRLELYVVVKMTIPKGSKYYISNCGKEIVSNKLKWPATNKKILL